MPFNFFEILASIRADQTHCCAGPGCTNQSIHHVVNENYFYDRKDLPEPKNLKQLSDHMPTFNEYFKNTTLYPIAVIPGNLGTINCQIKLIAKGTSITKEKFNSTRKLVYICTLPLDKPSLSAFWHPTCVERKIVTMAKLAHTERRPSIFSNMLKLRTASTSLPPSQANMIAENDILLFFFDPQPSASVSPPFLAVKTEAVMSSLTSPSAAYPADAPPLYGNVLQREHPGSAHPGSASPKPTNPFPKNTASRAADNPPFAPTNQTVVNAGAIPTASYNPFEDTSASRLTPPISAAYPTDAPPLYGNVPQRAHPDSAPPKRTNPFLKSPASLAADNPPFAPTNQTVVNAGAIPTASYNPFDETSDS